MPLSRLAAMDEPKKAPPAPPPPPVAVGRALLKGVKPGERVCAVSGLAVYQGRKGAAHMAIIALEGREPEHKLRLARVAKFGNLTGLKVEHVDESLVLATPLPSGTLADLPVLGWPLTRRLEVFRALVVQAGNLHRAGERMGPLPPDHIFLDDNLMPFFLGPRIGDAKGAFAAVETLREGRVDNVSDIFVLGRLLQFVVSQNEPASDAEPLPRLDDLLSFPAGLSRIVRKCVTADRLKRYNSVDELLADFDRYGEYQSVGLSHPDARETNFTRLSAPPPPKGGLHSPKPGAVTLQKHGAVTMPKMAAVKTAAKTTGGKMSPVPPPPRKASWLEFGGLVRVAFAVVGLLAAAAAVAISYSVGFHPVGVGLLVVGAAVFGMGLVPSGARGEAPWRLGLGIVLGIAVAVANPLPKVAAIGATKRLASNDPAVRARAVRQLVAVGRTAFRGLDLEQTSFVGTRFIACDLSNVSFRAANLSKTLFSEVNLSGANFAGAVIEGASFADTDVGRAVAFETSICDDLTLLPPGWICVEAKPRRAEDVKAQAAETKANAERDAGQ